MQVLINTYLSCNIDGLVHQYEEIWSQSTWQDQSHCSTGIWNCQDMCSYSSNLMSSYWLAQRFARRRKTIYILKLFSSVVYNACKLLSYMEICVTKTIYLRFIPLGWQRSIKNDFRYLVVLKLCLLENMCV